eukprot:TRINITY_DN12290_c0_g1_i2.p1 TRINITY_DN12290_c0_g1~~TRINITY_DN12290_c0_g1_i2.p1  ORF type:complete len:1127 (+),score=238.03 TRINITY_DN12290_c0_g1_i2:86-3382(+)
MPCTPPSDSSTTSPRGARSSAGALLTLARAMDGRHQHQGAERVRLSPREVLCLVLPNRDLTGCKQLLAVLVLSTVRTLLVDLSAALFHSLALAAGRGDATAVGRIGLRAGAVAAAGAAVGGGLRWCRESLGALWQERLAAALRQRCLGETRAKPGMAEGAAARQVAPAAAQVSAAICSLLRALPPIGWLAVTLARRHGLMHGLLRLLPLLVPAEWWSAAALYWFGWKGGKHRAAQVCARAVARADEAPAALASRSVAQELVSRAHVHCINACVRAVALLPVLRRAPGNREGVAQLMGAARQEAALMAEAQRGCGAVRQAPALAAGLHTQCGALIGVLGAPEESAPAAERQAPGGGPARRAATIDPRGPAGRLLPRVAQLIRTECLRRSPSLEALGPAGRCWPRRAAAPSTPPLLPAAIRGSGHAFAQLLGIALLRAALLQCGHTVESALEFAAAARSGWLFAAAAALGLGIDIATALIEQATPPLRAAVSAHWRQALRRRFRRLRTALKHFSVRFSAVAERAVDSVSHAVEPLVALTWFAYRASRQIGGRELGLLRACVPAAWGLMQHSRLDHEALARRGSARGGALQRAPSAGLSFADLVPLCVQCACAAADPSGEGAGGAAGPLRGSVGESLRGLRQLARLSRGLASLVTPCAKRRALPGAQVPELPCKERAQTAEHVGKRGVGVPLPLPPAKVAVRRGGVCTVLQDRVAPASGTDRPPRAPELAAQEPQRELLEAREASSRAALDADAARSALDLALAAARERAQIADRLLQGAAAELDAAQRSAEREAAELQQAAVLADQAQATVRTQLEDAQELIDELRRAAARQHPPPQQPPQTPAPPPPQQHPWQPGFSTERVLGSGRWGTARLMRRERDGGLYVVKEVRTRRLSPAEPPPMTMSAAVREAELLRQVHEHPHIVRMYEYVVCPASHNVRTVLEFAKGGDLAVWSARVGTPGGAELQLALRALQGVAEALSHLHHDVWMVHRDVKGPNVLLVADGESWASRLADFGCAALLDPDYAVAGPAGDPTISAPETKSRGKRYSTPVDLWSFGLMVRAVLREAVGDLAAGCGCLDPDQRPGARVMRERIGARLSQLG